LRDKRRRLEEEEEELVVVKMMDLVVYWLRARRARCISFMLEDIAKVLFGLIRVVLVGELWRGFLACRS
jgi:hypothetical protein